MKDKTKLRCENCVHATEPKEESMGEAKWIRVICVAPIPACANHTDDTEVGHLAAMRCPCYEEC